MSHSIPEQMGRLRVLLDTRGTVDKSKMSENRAGLYEKAGALMHSYVLLAAELQDVFQEARLVSRPHALSVTLMEDEFGHDLQFDFPIPKALFPKLVFQMFSVYSHPAHSAAIPLYVKHFLDQKSFKNMTDEEIDQNRSLLDRYTVAHAPNAQWVLQKIITSLEKAQK
jgi:hypothetical protein